MGPLKLVLSGDILPTRRLNAPGATTRAIYERVRAADFAIGNFEMPLTRGGAPIQKLLNIRADPDIAADAPLLGFRVLTLANNHAVDYGMSALEETALLLSAQGVTVVGVGATRDQAAGLAVHAVAGRRIGVIAFSCLTPTGMSAGANRAGISPLHVETGYEIDPWYQMEEPGDPAVVKIRTRVRAADFDWAEDLVRNARRKCDLLVVTVHWGFGSGELLAEYQEPLGKALIEAGADLIHGHHPHAVHPVGFHRGAPLLYGLGTFIGQQVFLPAPPPIRAMWAAMSPDGVLAELRFEEGRPPTVALIPTTLDNDRLPRLATGAEFDRIAERLVRLSAPYGAAVTRGDGVLHVAPLP